MTDTTKQGLGSDKMDPQMKQDIKSGQTTSSPQDMTTLGQKGGQAAQQGSNVHTMTKENRMKGGQTSPTNLANRPTEKMKDIASKGGQASHKDE